VSYRLVFSKNFTKSYEKLVAKSPSLVDKLRSTFTLLGSDPFNEKLGTHKVVSRNHGKTWSSVVTGDLRVVWIPDSSNNLIIHLLDLGGHSGKNKVYK
jgi:mRNA-degrading endonuclease YafQ of YafQ-DinJ toxin-antitoxin module